MQFISDHIAAILFGAYVVFSLAVTALPADSKDFNAYHYFRAVALGLVGVAGARMGNIPPANPLEPK